jgi:hypothetical protein
MLAWNIETLEIHQSFIDNYSKGPPNFVKMKAGMWGHGDVPKVLHCSF